MYRGFTLSSSSRCCAVAARRSLLAITAKTSTTTIPNQIESTSSFFTAPTKPLLAFESRSGPRPVVRAANSSNNRNNNSNSNNDNNNNNAKNEQQQQTAGAGQTNISSTTVSQKFPQIVNNWKRMLAQSENSPNVELKNEFLETLLNQSNNDNDNEFSTLLQQIDSNKVQFDSQFVQTLLLTAAAVLPLPFMNSSPSAFSKQRDQQHQYTTAASRKTQTTLPNIISKAIEWVVKRRQQPQAYDNGPLSFDAAVAHFCLIRLGFLNNTSASNTNQQQQQIMSSSTLPYSLSFSSSSSSSSITTTEVHRRLALNQRELRNLTVPSLATIIYTSSFLGKAAMPAGEACALKLSPILQQPQVQNSMTLQQCCIIAAVVFDPSNVAVAQSSSVTERLAIALRKTLSTKLSNSQFTTKTNLDQIAGTQSGVVVSLISSLLRDPVSSSTASSSDNNNTTNNNLLVEQFAQLFLLENENMTICPRSALELIRAFCERTLEDAEKAMVSSSTSNNNENNGKEILVKSIGHFCSKLTKEQLRRDNFCAVELYQFLTLSCVQKYFVDSKKDETFSKFANLVFSFIEEELSKDFLKALLSNNNDTSSGSAVNNTATETAWLLADSLLSGLSRRCSSTSISDETATDTTNKALISKLSSAYLQNLLNNDSNNINNTKTARRIASLLKAPNMIQNADLQRLISSTGSKHSAPLSDILIILEGLTSSPFCRNSHEARQLARSIAPTSQFSSSSSSNNNNNNGETPNSNESTTSNNNNSKNKPVAETTTTSNASPVATSQKEELIRTAHCFGLLRVREESLCQVLIARALQLRDDLTADDLGVFVFALARMDERNPKPYVDLAHRVRAVTSTASASAATAIIVSYARAAAVWNYTMYFRLCERIVEQKSTWKRRDMLPLLIALLRLELRHEKILELATIELMKSDANTLSTEECVRFLSILTQFTPNTPIVAKLGEIFVQRQNELSSVQMGEVLSSLGRAYVGISKILDGEKASLNNNTNNSKDSTNTLSIIEKFEQELSGIRNLFEKLVFRTTLIIPSAPPVAIASILNGFAALKYAHKEIFAVLGDRLLQIKTECPALVIGQALHSFATVGLRDDKLFVEMIPRVRFVAHHGSPQDVANVLTAYTTVQLWHYKLFVRLAERAIAIRADCRPHHIAQILNAFAKVEMKYDKLFIELSPRIQVVSGSATASDVTTIVASYAQMNLYDAPVFSQMADRAVQIGSQFTGQEALKMIESFDKLKIQHEALRKALGKKAEAEKERIVSENSASNSSNSITSSNEENVDDNDDDDSEDSSTIEIDDVDFGEENDDQK